MPARPRGNDADLPPAPNFAEGWTYGREPDVILEMPVEFDIPGRRRARRADLLLEDSRSPRTSSPRCSRLRPSNRAVVHHSGVFVVDIPEGAQIVEGRLVGPDGKPFMERTEAGLPKTETGTLPGASKLLSWVPGRGLDVHRAERRQAHPGRQIPELAAPLQPDRQARKGSLAARHLVQQGAGHARTADPPGRRPDGHRQERPVALPGRGQGSRVQGRHRAARAAAAPRRTSRPTPRTGRSSASRRSPSRSRSTRCRRTCTCAARACAGSSSIPTAGSRPSSTCRSSTSTGSSTTS